jgi:zinc D-Ala-D-Ala carboxypeptidase
MERRTVNTTAYLLRIKAIHQALGIPADYGKDTGLPAYIENEQVVTAGKDHYNRDLFLTVETSLAWNSLQLAAGSDGISLIAVSGFRSVERQQQIFERKIKSGVAVSMILTVNAAPGYSQHHTGCAIDVTDLNSCEKPLEEDFESMPAFAWLMQHAEEHGFHLEYPRNNPWGFIYEPWHWVYSEAQKYMFFAGGGRAICKRCE